MGHHAEHGGVGAERSERRDSEHHESHVRDRRERDQALHVLLGETAQRTVNDADHRQGSDIRSPLDCGLGKCGDRDAHEPVGTELQQDGREDHRTLRRRLCVCIRQPGVEREHRHLHGESHEHASEDPNLHVLGDRGTVLHEVWNREALCTRLEEQGQERHEHQCRTEHRVEEELQRRILTLLATPHTDHEVHRQQHHFKEHEEQDQVLGDERSRHARLQDEHQAEECLGVTRRRNVIQAVDHDEERDHHRQEVQGQADAVYSDEVAALDHRDPCRIGDELHGTRIAEVEACQREHTDGQGRTRGNQSDRLDQTLLRLRHDQHQGHAEHRQERADTE